MIQFTRIAVSVFVLLFAATAFAGGPERTPAPVTERAPAPVTVKVKVKQTKVNGKAWDAFGGAPDIALCIDGSGGMKCYPDGDSPRKIAAPQCRDAYTCTFRKVKIPSGEFEVIVVDVDAMANDIIGEEDCRGSGKCRVGQAKVTFK
jgi:hypothetical protein